MRISILTLFPEMFKGPFSCSIIKRAIDKNLVTIHFVNIRDFATDKHRSVDDKPFGGGQGMIMKVDVLDQAIQNTILSSNITRKETRILLMDPRGTIYQQTHAKNLSTSYTHIILVCAHYEGFDERILDFIDEQISIGDFILTGGEIPAMMITDSIVRLLPNVLKNPESAIDESFSNPNLLEFPQYTRPVTYKNKNVPDILRNGDHKAIGLWKKMQSIEITKKNRMDLVKRKIS